MLRIGITGGIGAGKSLVLEVLMHLGYPVFNSDESAKQILNENNEVRQLLLSEFGDSVYANNQLNREELARIIFNNEESMQFVNQLIHPRVRRAFEDFCKVNPASAIFNEAAILFETGAYENFDKMVLIAADESTRIQRVMKRDGSSEESIRARINKQWPDDQKMPLADFVIDNSENSSVLLQIESMLDQFGLSLRA